MEENCVVEGCFDQQLFKKMCRKHYDWDRNGRGTRNKRRIVVDNDNKVAKCGCCLQWREFDKFATSARTNRPIGLCRDCFIAERKIYRGAGDPCACGCGGDTVWGAYIQGHQNTGERNRRWKGGRHESRSGYVYILCSDGTYALEHRVVMEQHLGRKLKSKENVHHKNGDKADNRIENLELWTTSQPSGQRLSDKIAWAKEILEEYGEI